VDFVVTAGDNRYDSISMESAIGERGELPYGKFLPAADGTGNRFFPCIGNHDVSDGGGIDEYLDFFDLPGTGVPTSGTSGTETYYDARPMARHGSGDVHFFLVDSEEVQATVAEQQAWLQAQLAASTAPWKIVLMHHAPYSSSANHGSQSYMQWPFAAWGANVVIAGHDHHYERIETEGIVYFVNGAGGRSLYPVKDTPVPGSQVTFDSDHGAQLVEVGGGYIHLTFVSRTGEIIDDVIYSLESLSWAAPPPSPAVPPGECDEASWPDVDGLVCGECKVLVDNFRDYGTCDGYCESIGRVCTGAWEEDDETCDVKHGLGCDESLSSSDALCECGASGGTPGGECQESAWPNVDHGLVCGDCKVLVDNFDSDYGSCDAYCASFGRACTGAWEEDDETCDVLHSMTCDGSVDSSDALCECGANAGPCDETSWPDVDHGLVCGECKVLVDNFDSVYFTCDGYCESIGLDCTGAWEEDDETCGVAYTLACDSVLSSSDAICECGDAAPPSPPGFSC